ncbi:GntR family transcriptional regulator [Nonomuraea sp. NPDC048916]|uniref:GntR family transcriptional regulator n=1 Tax=Nonomuraea sp. NPDC048916 TaxID=3154232 RepID=UPI0033D1172E
MSESPWGGGNSLGVAKLSVPTLVEVAITEIRKLILSGQLKPGERLIEERLTEILGISRPPVREALRVLQRDGIVQSQPRHGFIVVPITAKDVREIYSLRMALERLAVDLGVPVRDPARLAPLRTALDEMRAAAELNDDEGILFANSAFHRALIALPGHSRLERAYDSLVMQLSLCMAYNLKFRQRLHRGSQDSVVRHESLLRKIELGDKDALIHEIEHHGAETFLDHLDELIGGD